MLNVGKTALLTQRMSIDVTGHNIANVNTDGYSRQRVNTEANTPVSSQAGQEVGTGVKAREIQRIYDRFVEGQINTANQELGRWEARKDALERAEMIFDESSGYGLSQALGEFWNVWQDLANNPSGQAERSMLVVKSETLAATFNRMYSDLIQIQKDIDTRIGATVEEINLIANQIAGLNDKISHTELTGQNANDNRDKRSLLLKELSSLIDINSFEKSNGELTILVIGGKPLVDGTTPRDLSTQPDAASGLLDILWVDGTGSSQEITGNISSGKLKGLLEARDGASQDYLDRLDTLAGNLIGEVNTIHAGGLGLDGLAGGAFFTGNLASDMAVSQDIVDDVNKIAAAGILEGIPGGNSNAISMANLQNKLTMNAGNTAIFDDYYNSLVSNVGSGVKEATINFDHQSSITDRLNNYRESISGVSLEEEMINLIKFQHAYDAAAKLITTVDELLKSVINLL